jgi:hypothetical protein
VSVKYLLPCSSCGEKIPVEVSQAGQQIECNCRAILEIPTMAGIRALQRAELSPEDQRPISRWEARHGVLLAGAVITVAALCMTTYVYKVRPQPVEVEDLSPFRTLQAWQFLREGVRRPAFEVNPYRIHQMRQEANRRWMVVSLSLVALGLIVMSASVLVPKRRLKRRIVRIPVQESQVPRGEPPLDGPDT